MTHFQKLTFFSRGNLNNKIFQKIKTFLGGVILDPFYQNLGKNEFFWKRVLYQFLNIPIIYHCVKHQKKLMLIIPQKNAKLTDGQTDGQTENDDFFQLLFGCTQPTLGHSQGDCLTHPMLIIVFYIFNPKVTVGWGSNEINQRSNFSYEVVGNIIVEAESQRHNLPRQCLNNLFAKAI